MKWQKVKNWIEYELFRFPRRKPLVKYCHKKQIYYFPKEKVNELIKKLIAEDIVCKDNGKLDFPSSVNPKVNFKVKKEE